MLINRDNIFGLRVPAKRNFFQTLIPEGYKKLSDGKTNDIDFLKPDIDPYNIQTFSSYLTGNKIFLLLL